MFIHSHKGIEFVFTQFQRVFSRKKKYIHLEFVFKYRRLECCKEIYIIDGLNEIKVDVYRAENIDTLIAPTQRENAGQRR